MKIIMRVLLGALLGFLAWVLAFFVTGSVLVSHVWPHSFRVHHGDFMEIATKVLVVIPCVIALGVIFRRMFSSDRRTLCAIAAMAVALVAESAETVFPPGSPGLVVLPFLLGPAAVAYLLDRWRSNSQ